MSRLWNRIVVGMIAVVLIVSGFSVYVSAENSDAQESRTSGSAENADNNEGKMNVDVMFVMDDSGSMFKSDPDKISRDAYSLFTELLDGSCGVGYVSFTHEIISYGKIVNVSDSDSMKSQKKKVMELEYDNRGFTDISLALKKAAELLTDNKVRDNGRKKCVVLLTDGNTNLVGKGRTTQDSLEELDDVLKKLSDRGIPVYSIGLNSNGKLNRDEIDKISGNTGGNAFEVTDSEQLLDVFVSVFGSINQVKGDVRKIVDGNVDITIPSDGVFSTSILIQSKIPYSEMNPVLKAPGGTLVPLIDSNEIILTSTKSYTLIKIIYPVDGVWKLHLDKVTDKDCKVMQIDYHSLYVKAKVSNSVAAKNPLVIRASVSSEGGRITDEELLDRMEAEAVVSKGGKSETLEMKQTRGDFVCTWTGTQKGIYYVKVIVDTGRFKKESNLCRVEVTDAVGLDEMSSSEAANNIGVDGEKIDKVIIIAAVIIGIVIVAVVCGIIIINKNRKKALERESQRIRQNAEVKRPEPAPQPKPAPKPMPAPVIEKVKPSPKPTDPDYVDYEIIEHDSLENLIKKGPDDAFNLNSDNYKTDAALEALIKKGPDDTLGVGKEETSYDEDDEYDDDEYEDDEYEDDE